MENKLDWRWLYNSELKGMINGNERRSDGLGEAFSCF